MIRKIINDSVKHVKIFSKITHISDIAEDYFNLNGKIVSNEEHLKAAIVWLCRAQDITKNYGVSAGYSLEKGWLPPYPETTGYIIKTFINYSEFTSNDEYLNKAIQMGDWEINVQMDNGAVRGGVGINDYPIVFNTGQVISGWVSLFKKTKLERFRDAAKRAGDWLISIQDDDGKWSKYTFQNIPHTYSTRVAWPMLRLYEITDEKKYFVSGERNIDWTLENYKGNGWFDKMHFNSKGHPFTHTIAYTLQGLLESSNYLNFEKKERIQKIVYTAAENIMFSYELRKRNPYSLPHILAGNFDENWKPASKYSCLTGNAQLSIIWLELFKLTNDGRFLNSALKLMDQTKAKQDLLNSNPGIKGAIAGSFPIWGKYREYSYPNWASKFFADALMLQEEIMNKLDENKI
ncbi:MAG TPA: hypothetical protein VLN45_12220 [Ignavibacteriaceae bacterium]|nr:hypothetical protein [Ignavibacteriaceae bacterium]